MLNMMLINKRREYDILPELIIEIMEYVFVSFPEYLGRNTMTSPYVFYATDNFGYSFLVQGVHVWPSSRHRVHTKTMPVSIVLDDGSVITDDRNYDNEPTHFVVPQDYKDTLSFNPYNIRFSVNHRKNEDNSEWIVIHDDF
jgi:hypothetical protein